MPIKRIPVTYDIGTRDGSLTKDSKIVNAYAETIGNTRYLIKRPGTATLANLPSSGGSFQGQGLFYYNNQLYAVVSNVLYQVNVDGTYTSIGTMTGDTVNCYFTQSLPTPIPSSNTATGNYTFSVHGSYTLTIPAGVYIAYASVIGAGGGGGGGTFSSGDSHAGAGGGSGGYILNQSFLVQPGQQINIVVGQGGYNGANYNNGTWTCVNGVVGNNVQGSTGGTSSVTLGSSLIVQATGGTGGGGFSGAVTGYGGSPNGVNGQNNNSANYQGTNYGGNNGTGFGNGGTGGTMYSPVCGTNGQDGAVIIKY